MRLECNVLLCTHTGNKVGLAASRPGEVQTVVRQCDALRRTQGCEAVERED